MGRVLAVRIVVKRRAKGKCEICRNLFCPKPHRQSSPSMHHLFPQRDGGSDSLFNLIYICLSCHEEIHADESYSYAIGRLRKIDSPQAPIYLNRWVILGETLTDLGKSWSELTKCQ